MGATNQQKVPYTGYITYLKKMENIYSLFVILRIQIVTHQEFILYILNFLMILSASFGYRYTFDKSLVKITIFKTGYR